MPIHNFGFVPRQQRTVGKVAEPKPSIPQKIPKTPDLSKKTTITFDPTNVNIQEDVRTTLPMGFHALDEGIKNYFIDIKIPSKDDFRKMEVRIAGGDKTLLFWRQDSDTNRIKLPVMSINRTALRWDATRFSPPYIEMTRRFVENDGSRVALVYRPWPCQVDYTNSIWAERKRDAEYALYQIITRFNPLAEFTIEFPTLRGNVRGKIGEVTDNSDIDVGADEMAEVRYDINITYEAWLPLPERVIPTVLGRVGIVSEFSGAVLDIADFDNSIPR